VDKFYLFPPEAANTARQVDLLFFALTGVTLFFIIVVFVPLIFFALKYRRGSKADRSNPSSGSIFLESGWTLLPLVISIALFCWGAAAYYHMERLPADALQVQVVGKQWMWKLQHAEGKKEINELHVPLGRAVRLTMTSQDVIHSFFIPAFRVKQDAVPGRYTGESFRPTKVGEYHLFCAEYCGTKHSGMIGRVVVMEPADYENWLTSGETAESVAFAGERLFREYGCSGCHSVNSQFRAPLLEGIYGKPVPLSTGQIVNADDRYLRDSILLPAKQISAGYENIMPSYAGRLSEEEIMQIIAYLKSIADQPKPNQSR
jgi:cytochrome c oxidase subunit II